MAFAGIKFNDRDFAADGEVVITKIDVVEVKPEPVRLEA